MQSFGGFIYYKKLFFAVGYLTLISVNTRIFAKTNNKRMKYENYFEKIVFQLL